MADIYVAASLLSQGFAESANAEQQDTISKKKDRADSEDFRPAREEVDMFITSTPVLLVFTGQLIATRGVKFALLPHFYLLCAYEVRECIPLPKV